MSLGEVPLTVIDLFCGAGGLSLGFQRASFQVVHAFDCWKPAVDTYQANFGAHVTEADITTDLDLPSSTLLVGGPPCQGFSSAGRRQDDDNRNSLVAVFAQLVARYKPRAFVFENVEGFLTGGKGRFVFELLEPVIEAGYCVHLRKINAANYGVPQHRKRVVVIGGLGWSPSFPEPTHAAFGAPGAHLGNGHGAKPSPTLDEAFRIIPAASDVMDHHQAALDGEDLQRAKLLKPGQRMRDLPESLWHESYRRRAFRRVMDGTPTEKRGGAPAGIRRLRGDEPSKAITGGALRDFMHPSEDRMLTVRECAVLQTFPIDFEFRGTQSQKIQLIGNAVPPRLAEAIASGLREDLERANPESELEGRLLSFVPTLSTGMSPALAELTRRVEARFLRASSPEHQPLLWD